MVCKKITDITPLSGLTNLTKLDFKVMCKELIDITPLSGLTNLTDAFFKWL